MANKNLTFSQQVSEKEFNDFFSKTDFTTYTKSDASELEKIEDILNVRRGLLKDEEYYVNDSTCTACGKKITFFDFVKTAIDESAHSKSFLLHSLVGNDFGFQKPSTIKCSSCGAEVISSHYKTPNYSCQER